MSHCILTDTYLLGEDNSGFYKVDVNTSTLDTIYKYVELAQDWNVSQIWVHPDSNLSNSFLEYESDFMLGRNGSTYYHVSPDISPYMSVERKHSTDKKRISIILPAYLREDIPDLILDDSDCSTLYNYVKLLRELLNVPFTRDAKGTGIELFESFYKFSDLWLPKTDKRVFYTNKQVDRQWSRSLSSEEKKYKHLYTVDINTMYLSSTKGLLVGKGKCVIDASTPFNPDYPGLWLVRLLNTTALEAMGYPSIFESPSYQSTELVAKAIALGYQVEVLSSCTFKDSWEMFNPWYMVLENALDMDRQVKQINSELDIIKPFIKRLCNPMIGLMGREPNIGDSDKWYNRPDIYNSVVASSIARLYTALGLMSQASIPVVYIDVDTIGYLSNEPFERSLPDDIPLSSNIGDFRHTGTYPVKQIAKYCTNSIHTLKGRIKEIRNNG